MVFCRKFLAQSTDTARKWGDHDEFSMKTPEETLVESIAERGKVSNCLTFGAII
jgi:hypothetical protein